MELFETTIAELLRWLLRTAQAMDKLGHVAGLTVAFAKKQIADGGIPVVRNKEVVKRVFLITMDHLDFVEPDNSIREALLGILSELCRISIPDPPSRIC